MYDREVDLIERIERRDRIWDPDNGSDPVQPSGSQDPDCPKVLVDKEEYKELKQKAATLDKILMLLRRTENEWHSETYKASFTK